MSARVSYVAMKNGECKGPEAGSDLIESRSIKKVGISRVEWVCVSGWVAGKVVGDKVRKIAEG